MFYKAAGGHSGGADTKQQCKLWSKTGIKENMYCMRSSVAAELSLWVVKLFFPFFVSCF